MLRHGVDRHEQLAHGRHRRDLRKLATLPQALVVGAEPRVVPDGHERDAEPAVPYQLLRGVDPQRAPLRFDGRRGSSTTEEAAGRPE